MIASAASVPQCSLLCSQTGEFKLRDIWEKPLHKVSRLVDVRTPYTVEDYASLWDAGNDAIQAAHDTINNWARCAFIIVC